MFYTPLTNRIITSSIGGWCFTGVSVGFHRAKRAFYRRGAVTLTNG